MTMRRHVKLTDAGDDTISVLAEFAAVVGRCCHPQGRRPADD